MSESNQEKPRPYKEWRFEQITKHMLEIYKKKNADYGDSFSESVRELGLISAITRINDKCNRLKSLVKQPAHVVDESMLDTLLDLANYAILTIMEIDNAVDREVGEMFEDLLDDIVDDDMMDDEDEASIQLNKNEKVIDHEKYNVKEVNIDRFIEMAKKMDANSFEPFKNLSNAMKKAWFDSRVEHEEESINELNDYVVCCMAVSEIATMTEEESIAWMIHISEQQSKLAGEILMYRLSID